MNDTLVIEEIATQAEPSEVSPNEAPAATPTEPPVEAPDTETESEVEPERDFPI